jgi:hypothetical protein
MSVRLLIALLIGIAATIHASDNSVEVTLELPPPQSPPPHWKLRPDPALQDSDSQGDLWRDKFITASDKPFGSAKDLVTVQSLVPSSSLPVTVRWLSRSVVLVSAGCHSDSDSTVRVRCLYVLEKHHSKWKITHHYRQSHFFPHRSNHALESTATR